MRADVAAPEDPVDAAADAVIAFEQNRGHARLSFA